MYDPLFSGDSFWNPATVGGPENTLSHLVTVKQCRMSKLLTLLHNLYDHFNVLS
jgi:hypothetical protein